MPRIVRTPAANRDFSIIAAYLADKSLNGALNWIEGIDRILDLLANNPLLGETVDHLGKGVRRHTFGNYLLFYRPIESGIEVQRILHGSRTIESLSDCL
jgi:toxin ParE1/3/4